MIADSTSFRQIPIHKNEIGSLLQKVIVSFSAIRRLANDIGFQW